MANIRNGNTFFMDTVAADEVPATTGNLNAPSVRVKGLIVSGVGGNADLDLHDCTTDAHKLHVYASSGTTVALDFSNSPIIFPNGIHVSTCTNTEATVIIEEVRQ